MFTNQIVMKLKLLCVLLLFVSLCWSQSAINNYFSAPASTYAIASGTIDQSPVGANALWDFTSLSSTGSSADAISTPTAGETSTYPGTTGVFTVTNNIMGENKIFFNQSGNQLSITGATNPDFVLNYSSDNGLLGNYPFNFNDTYADTIGGTFTFGALNGTFAGNINTTVDAYGILSVNDLGQGAFNGSVTRIKTEQVVVASVMFFPNAATITVTNYNYYNDANGDLVFRTSTVDIVSSLAGNSNATTIESLLTSTLSNQKIIIDEYVTIAQNPVSEILDIRTTNGIVFMELQLMDMNGKEVLLLKNTANPINIAHLPSGLYLGKVITNKGDVVKKIIKL